MNRHSVDADNLAVILLYIYIYGEQTGNGREIIVLFIGLRHVFLNTLHG